MTATAGLLANSPDCPEGEYVLSGQPPTWYGSFPAKMFGVNGEAMAEAISPVWYSVARLSAVELAIVHGFAQTARPKACRSFAVALSWLGNGWIYLAIAVGSIATAGFRAIPVIGIGALNAGLLHCVYPLIKRWVARPRPYRRDPTLRPLLKVLDEHAFPSGHAMTLMAMLVPLVLAFPQTLSFAVAIWLLTAWARLASAHHYPSDVAAGTALGASVSYPISVYALAASGLIS